MFTFEYKHKPVSAFPKAPPSASLYPYISTPANPLIKDHLHIGLRPFGLKMIPIYQLGWVSCRYKPDQDGLKFMGRGECSRISSSIIK